MCRVASRFATCTASQSCSHPCRLFLLLGKGRESPREVFVLFGYGVQARESQPSTYVALFAESCSPSLPCPSRLLAGFGCDRGSVALHPMIVRFQVGGYADLAEDSLRACRDDATLDTAR